MIRLTLYSISTLFTVGLIVLGNHMMDNGVAARPVEVPQSVYNESRNIAYNINHGSIFDQGPAALNEPIRTEAASGNKPVTEKASDTENITGELPADESQKPPQAPSAVIIASGAADQTTDSKGSETVNAPYVSGGTYISTAVSGGGSGKLSAYWKKLTGGNSSLSGVSSMASKIISTKTAPDNTVKVKEAMVKLDTTHHLESTKEETEEKAAVPEPAQSAEPYEMELTVRQKQRLMEFQRRLNMRLQQMKASRSRH